MCHTAAPVEIFLRISLVFSSAVCLNLLQPLSPFLHSLAGLMGQVFGFVDGLVASLLHSFGRGIHLVFCLILQIAHSSPSKHDPSNVQQRCKSTATG